MRDDVRIVSDFIQKVQLSTTWHNNPDYLF